MGPEPAETETATAEWSPDILRFFRYVHLPVHLQAVSKPFGELAAKIVADTAQPSGMNQAQLALEHLLIAKDMAVRAAMG